MGSSPSSVLSTAPPKRLGSETPRIFTPPLRKLTPKTSAGFSCIEFSEQVLGIVLFPWQKWLLIHALELLPDGTYRFRTVVLLVARQNGKSTLMQVLSLWRMFVTGAPLVIGTAQNLDVAEEQWEGAVEIAEGNEELAAEITQVSKVNGKKFMRIRGNKRYKVAAASRRGGRGLSGDLILLDELREHQNWEAWAAVTKTTMARALAQIWAASNAGDLTSVVLAFLRLLAHHALGNPDNLKGTVARPDEVDDEEADSLGIFEWSAVPGCSIWDRDAWAQANPSLGYSITERAIASSARTDPEMVFRTEVLCQWVDSMDRVISEPGWIDSLEPGYERGDALAYAVDIDEDTEGTEWCSLAVSDGALSELAKTAPSSDWLVAGLVEKGIREVGLIQASPAAKLINPLEAAGITVRLVKPAEFNQACQQYVDGINHRRIKRRIEQGALSRAAAIVARREVDDGGFRFSRKASPGDISPLNACTVAVWMANTAVPVPTPGFMDLDELLEE